MLIRKLQTLIFLNYLYYKSVNLKQNTGKFVLKYNFI